MQSSQFINVKQEPAIGGNNVISRGNSMLLQIREDCNMGCSYCCRISGDINTSEMAPFDKNGSSKNGPINSALQPEEEAILQIIQMSEEAFRKPKYNLVIEGIQPSDEFLRRTDRLDMNVIMTHDGISSEALEIMGESRLLAMDAAARLLLGHRPESSVLYPVRAGNPVFTDIARFHHLGFRRIGIYRDANADKLDFKSLKQAILKAQYIYDDTEFFRKPEEWSQSTDEILVAADGSTHLCNRYASHLDKSIGNVYEGMDCESIKCHIIASSFIPKMSLGCGSSRSWPAGDAMGGKDTWDDAWNAIDMLCGR